MEQKLQDVESLRQLGYTKVRTIGAGSFGLVNLYTNQAGKKFAIKLMRSLDDGDYIYQAEIGLKLMKNVIHPNVIKVFDVVKSSRADEGVCIIMEYSDGGNLAENKWSLKPKEAYEIMGQVAKGLVYLHNFGIIHRDIKPANIVLSKQSGRLVPKICDFGISKLIKNGQMTWTILGTSSYMAPEIRYQMGYTQNVDVWSFGIVLYEMLTGSRPFDKEPYTKDSRVQILHQKVFAQIFATKTYRATAEDLVKSLSTPLTESEINMCMMMKKQAQSNRDSIFNQKEEQLYASIMIPNTHQQKEIGKNFSPPKAHRKQLRTSVVDLGNSHTTEMQGKNSEQSIFKAPNSKPLQCASSVPFQGEGSLIVASDDYSHFKTSDFGSPIYEKPTTNNVSTTPSPTASHPQNNTILSAQQNKASVRSHQIEIKSVPFRSVPANPIKSPPLKDVQQVSLPPPTLLTRDFSIKSQKASGHKITETPISIESVINQNQLLRTELAEVKANLDDFRLKIERDTKDFATVKYGYEKSYIQHSKMIIDLQKNLSTRQKELKESYKSLQQLESWKSEVQKLRANLNQVQIQEKKSNKNLQQLESWKSEVQRLRANLNSVQIQADAEKVKNHTQTQHIRLLQDEVNNLRKLVDFFEAREEGLIRQFTEIYNKKVRETIAYQNQVSSIVTSVSSFLKAANEQMPQQKIINKKSNYEISQSQTPFGKFDNELKAISAVLLDLKCQKSHSTSYNSEDRFAKLQKEHQKLVLEAQKLRNQVKQQNEQLTILRSNHSEKRPRVDSPGSYDESGEFYLHDHKS